MKPPHVTEAKAIAERIGADAVVVLAFNDGSVAGASYGRTKAKCAATGKWMDALIDEMGADEIGAGPLASRRPTNRFPN
jgi:hypothetical protein